MILPFLALIVIGPLVELYLLIKAGAAFGALPVIAYCIATALIGAFLLRLQGLSALARAKDDIEKGQVPVEAAVDAVFLAIAAPLLVTPGFITDFIGFLLLAPFVRRALARAALSHLRRMMKTGEGRIYITRL